MMELIKDYRNLENGWNGGLSEVYVCCLNIINNKKVNNTIFDEQLIAKINNEKYNNQIQILLASINDFLYNKDDNKFVFEYIDDIKTLKNTYNAKIMEIVKFKYDCLTVIKTYDTFKNILEENHRKTKKNEKANNEFDDIYSIDMTREVVNSFDIFKEFSNHDEIIELIMEQYSEGNNEISVIEQCTNNLFKLKKYNGNLLNTQVSLEHFNKKIINFIKANINESIEKVKRNLIENTVYLNEFVKKYKISINSIEKNLINKLTANLKINDKSIADYYISLISEYNIDLDIDDDLINFFCQTLPFELNDNFESNLPTMLETHSKYYHGKFKDK